MQRTLLVLALVALAGSAFAQDVAQLTAETRKQALPVLPKVAGTMQDAVAKDGPAGAIPVCKDKAPQLLKEMSQATGWQMHRVSLKTRNPESGTPDAWEARHLADFNLRSAAGEKPEKLEVGEVVTEADGKQYFRYLKALPVAEVCLKCHGDPAKMGNDLKAQLAEQYPHDQATGYSLGQIRGALSVKRPL